MAEEFHAGICEGTWWNASKTMFSECSSPSSTGVADLGITFGWATNMVDIKARSCDNKESNNSVPHHSSIVFQAAHNHPKPRQPDSNSGGSNNLIDSTLKMMGFGLSSTSDWNQSFHARSKGRTESYNSILEEDINSRLSCQQEPAAMDSSQIQKEIPMDSASYGYQSTLLQGLLFESDPQPQQHSLNFNNRSINYMSTGATYGANANGILSPSWPKLAPFSNTKQVRNSASVMKKGNGEPPLKRKRIETPSPLPIFKVRKEKLGDQITALQQLVSPFGKTDTASVLHETIEHIKFLHDQVNVLSTPYMKQAAASVQQQEGIDHRLIDPEGPKQDLRTRGLCLVPISSTFPVANESTTDFWTPTLGGTFR